MSFDVYTVCPQEYDAAGKAGRALSEFCFLPRRFVFLALLLSLLFRLALAFNFSYDSYDRLDSGTDWTGTFGRSYDDLGNVVQSTRNYTGISPSTTYTFDYGYYPEGSRMTMANIAGTWTYYRDKDGRCTSIVSPAGTHGISYYDNGWESGRTLPNGTTTAYSYNGVGALTGLVNSTSGSVTRSSFGSFGYDGVFNLTGVSASIPPNTNQSRTLGFTYDTKDRLTADSSLATGSGYGYSNTFGYDAAGNPTTFRGATQTFNADNQNAAYTEDGNGNTTAAGTASMTFDPENHLKTRTVGSLGREYTYRADGLRASRKSTGPILSSPTYFLYDGGEPVLELSRGSVIAKNVFAPDGLVARHSGSAWTYYTFDHQGNVANRENASEGVVNNSTFDGYGKELCDGTPDCWGYNARWGYYHDLGTGFDLYLCQHRYYDATAGRWLTRDPIGYIGGVNVYGYCMASPSGAIDGSGHSMLAILAASAKAILCDALANKILQRVAELRTRFWNMWNDPHGLYPLKDTEAFPGSGTWDGHQIQFEAKQANLRKLLNNFATYCGGPPPCPSGWRWASHEMPVAPQQMPYEVDAPGFQVPPSVNPIDGGLPGPAPTPVPAPNLGPIPIPIEGGL